MLDYYYSNILRCPFTPQILQIAQKVEEIYPSTNILLDRGNIEYDALGRYQTLEQAKVMDIEIEEMMEKYNINYRSFFASQRKEIIKYVIESIED